MTTSASTVLPSSNSSPVFVKRLIGLPLFSLIFPSINSCDAPTSVPPPAPHTSAFDASSDSEGEGEGKWEWEWRRTEVVASSAPLGHREEAGAVRPEVRAEADLVQVLEELPASSSSHTVSTSSLPRERKREKERRTCRPRRWRRSAASRSPRRSKWVSTRRSGPRRPWAIPLPTRGLHAARTHTHDASAGVGIRESAARVGKRETYGRACQASRSWWS